ncbi:MAG: hypothetical protein AB8B50_13440 [Pirellulaceae bacterium]
MFRGKSFGNDLAGYIPEVTTEDDIEPFADATVRRFKQILLAILITALLVTVPLAYFLGFRNGRAAVRGEVLGQQTAVIETILKSDEKLFSGLHIEESPNMWVEIKGDVPTRADRDFLARLLERELGADVSTTLIRLVGTENFF